MRALFLALALAALLGAGTAFAQTETPAPDAAPTPQAAAPAPSPTPTPAYKFVWLPTPSPNAPADHAPQIREIDLGDQTLVTPGELRVRVKTSRDVTSVTARTLGREIGIPRQDAGVFVLSGMVPAVPAFLSGRTFDVDFVAATDDGRTATVTLPLGLQ
jgi:hypothetical protein